jgi:hypothetical protein
MRSVALALLLALAACAPLPEGGQRQLTAEGIRPGIGAAHDLGAARPPLGTTVRYLIHTPPRDEPSELEVSLERREGGYIRSETVRIPESSAVEAGLIASMIGQRDGRAAVVEGTDVVLGARDLTDALGRTVEADRGGPVIRWDPHDCRATPGECRTVRTNPDGRSDPLVVTTIETNGIWRREVRRDPASDLPGRSTLLEEAFYSLDEDGLLIDMNRLDHERDLGGYQEIRRAG